MKTNTSNTDSVNEKIENKESKLSKEESKSGFFRFIAYLQVIGIVLVVFGHSFHEYPDGSGGFSLPLFAMLYSFRMPLFMFVSGFLMVFTCFMRKNSRLSFGAFFRSKVKRLLLPFLVLSLVTFVPRCYMSGMADDALELSVHQFARSLIFCQELVIPYLWFLQASFTLLIVSHGLLSVARRFRIIDQVSYGVLFLLFAGASIVGLRYVESVDVWAMKNIFRFALYFALGCLYARWGKWVDRWVPWTSFGFFLLVMAAWVLAYSRFGLQYETSIPGILMCISLAKILEYRQWHLLDHLVGSNYIIFLLSWYFNVLTQQVMSKVVALPWWCYTLMSLFFGVYVPWLFYQLMLHYADSRWARATAFLLGQKLKKRL